MGGNWSFDTSSNGLSYQARFDPSSGYGAISLKDLHVSGPSGCDENSLLASVASYPQNGTDFGDGFTTEIGRTSEVSPIGTYRETRFYTSKHQINYPTAYEGEVISSAANDLDGDGLTDYVESSLNPDRDLVFCDTNVTPYVCAYPNPTKKDLYVEIDWMKDGNRTIKPSLTQLASVASSFANQGITTHFDTGQYGGGNELPVYVNELYFEPNANNLDFFDLKNGNSDYTANFNSNRDYIWHYMISGYKTKFWDADKSQWNTDSSGAAYPGDDDLFIAVGHIEDDQANFNYNDLDTALSGTIIHEIGHNICLSKNAYTGQSAGCQFDKIDTWASSLYDSVMNYTRQMYQVDYSDDANGSPNDHDDWTEVLNGGLKDFTDASNNSGDSGVSAFGKKDKKKKVVRGITSTEAKMLKKTGKLGG